MILVYPPLCKMFHYSTSFAGEQISKVMDITR